MTKSLLGQLQRIGGALMLPIAVLPVAGLLLRLGQPDLLHIAVMAQSGQAIFDNLGLLFAVGIAIGLARENHGAAGLAAVVAYLVTIKGAEVFIPVPPAALLGTTGHLRDLAFEALKTDDLTDLRIPAGILCGLLSGALYNRFYKISLPSYLAFFGGRRFVPIASGFAALLFALAFGLGWHGIQEGMSALSRAVLAAGPWGLFAYGVLNRILIVTGLHHMINSVAWFVLGNYHGATGDLNRFFAGDPTAGAFMAGFFPVMMFGLPAACLAMYHTALPERRHVVAGLLASIALTSFLTGVTEPVEFSFMFLAPALYVVHALLTGAAFVLMRALDVHLGFTFSAGLFDYVLNFDHATHPLLLLPVGALYFGLYYGIFRFAIVRFDLKTPGREEVEPAAVSLQAAPADRVRSYITALGGAANLQSIDACTTRLRLIVRTQDAIDVEALKRLGARGVVRPSATALQVVVGPTADQLASEIREAIAAMPKESLSTTDSHASPAGQGPAATAARTAAAAVVAAPPVAVETVAPAPAKEALRGLLIALGGRSNVRSVATSSSRLRIEVASAEAIDGAAIRQLGMRGVAIAAADCIHIIVGPGAAAAGASLRELLAV
ncbi:MAG TPA: N-acetylglucosamine-specific PTS transporter subunit IIBC [Steroidobacteraceae bacterium]|jgi:PTS system N-acetylglucosamine-specific IIC component|nr:N-acetylglucosamine-specific PTS transporter subunit IIBC [Steroidobacteraceae bacterium]